MISNKKQILQHLATPGFSLEREGPGKAYAATPEQLTYAKPERIVPDEYVSTGLFLFWFVCSFCVFNLLHAFKSLALFPPFGENGRSLFRRDFGSLVVSLPPPYANSPPNKKKKRTRKIFLRLSLKVSRVRNILILHANTPIFQEMLGWKPQPTLFFPKKLPG